MPDLVVAMMPGVVTALVVGGGLLAKVNRLESDVAKCVSREQLTLHMDLIRAEIGRLADRLPPRENTDPGMRQR